jgi:hypothetical protein
MKHLKWIIPIILLSALTLDWKQDSGFRLTAAYAQAGGALTISWSPPTEYTDGAPLLEQELDFYTFYCNGAALKEIDVVIGTHSDNVSLTALPTGSYTCELTVTALPITPNVGAESGPSNSINFTIGPRVPMAPADLSST